VTPTRNSGPTAGEAGWAFVGNPYPAPLDWSAVALADRSNLDAAMYVFESSSQYSGSYRTYTNGIGAGSPLIGSGQGFWVRVSNGQTAGSLTFRNSQRKTAFADQVAVGRSTADTRPQVQLTLAGPGGTDDLFVYAQPGATAGPDAGFDATKLPNPSGLNLAALAATGQELAIDGRPSFAAATLIPLSVQVPAAGRYALIAPTLANLPATTQVVLVDNLTGTRTDLRTLPATGYGFSTTATTVASRFFLNLVPAAAPLASAQGLNAATVALYPNPAQRRATLLLPALAGAGRATLTVLTTLGQQVQSQTVALAATGTTATLDLTGLPAGLYLVQVRAADQQATLRLVVE